jgi:hypothetical protein
LADFFGRLITQFVEMSAPGPLNGVNLLLLDDLTEQTLIMVRKGRDIDPAFWFSEAFQLPAKGFL